MFHSLLSCCIYLPCRRWDLNATLSKLSESNHFNSLNVLFFLHHKNFLEIALGVFCNFLQTHLNLNLNTVPHMLPKQI